MFEGAAGVVRWAGRRDGESGRWWINGFVSTMATTIGVRGGTCGSRLGGNSPGASLHVCTSVAFVCADGAVSSCCGRFSAAGCVGECGGAFEFTENRLFVGKEVADKTIGVFFV